ncbi:MAG TPA: MoaD/ThiS family protein [Chryseolinea sp.]|nr:MoaD/ThiS family protein [Chryseolinea sp.]
MATVFIPTPLRKFTNNTSKLEIQGNTVMEVINELTAKFPELKRHLINADGRIPNFINIFVDDDDIRNLEQERTMVKGSTIVSIVPAIAGGVS